MYIYTPLFTFSIQHEAEIHNKKLTHPCSNLKTCNSCSGVQSSVPCSLPISSCSSSPQNNRRDPIGNTRLNVPWCYIILHIIISNVLWGTFTLCDDAMSYVAYEYFMLHAGELGQWGAVQKRCSAVQVFRPKAVTKCIELRTNRINEDDSRQQFHILIHIVYCQQDIRPALSAQPTHIVITNRQHLNSHNDLTIYIWYCHI